MSWKRSAQYGNFESHPSYALNSVVRIDTQIVAILVFDSHVRYTLGTRRNAPPELLCFQEERLVGAVGIEPNTRLEMLAAFEEFTKYFLDSHLTVVSPPQKFTGK